MQDAEFASPREEVAAIGEKGADTELAVNNYLELKRIRIARTKAEGRSDGIENQSTRQRRLDCTRFRRQVDRQVPLGHRHQVEHPTASNKSVNDVKRANERTSNYANIDSK